MFKIVIYAILLVSVIAAQAPQIPPLPGLDKVGLGYDVLYGTFRNAALGWTFAQNKTWTNPNYPTLVYAIPDQINIVTFPEASVTKEQITAKSTQQYASSLAMSAGLSFSYGMFSMSGSVNVAKKYIESSSSTSKYTSTAQRLGLWQVTTVPPFLEDLKASQWFEEGIKSLPTQIQSEQDRARYTQFIQYFGTHYLNEVHFGGKASMSTAGTVRFFFLIALTHTTSLHLFTSLHATPLILFTPLHSMYSNYSSPSSSHCFHVLLAVNVFVYEVDKEETITVDIQAEFFAKLSGHWNESIQYKSKLYKDHHLSELSMIGGNPEITDWEKWIPTVKENPTIVFFKLAPLSDLIKNDEQKRQNIITMIDQYVQTSYKPASCQELKNSGRASTDGEYTVWYQGAKGKPFTVFCHQMNTPVPQDYISVKAGRFPGNKDINFGSYCAASTRSICQTYYDRLRIDPYSLFVDLNDQTFTRVSCQQGSATTTAYVSHVHCQCHGTMDDDTVDLTGTALTIDPSVTCKAAVGTTSVSCAIVGNQKLHMKGSVYDNQCAKIVPRSPSSDIAGEKFSLKLNVVDSQKPPIQE